MNESTKLLRDIADLYYNQDMKQADIGKRYGLSRAKVSRLLAEARDTGVVKIFIPDTNSDMSTTEEKLKTAFNLTGVKVVSIPAGDKSLALQIAAQEAAKFIVSYVDDGDIVGVSWGATLHEISKNIPLLNLPNTRIVQLSGNLDNADISNHATQIAYNFATRLSTISVSTLPCPVILDNPLILEILLHDEHVSKIMNLGKQCNKMIVNIGAPNEGNCLISSGYVKKETLAKMKELDVMGSMGCHFYNKGGDICYDELDKRTVGVGLENIKNCQCVISCVIGGGKEKEVITALRSGFLDVLIVDYGTATAILKLLDAN